jgi:hypothetical protein
MPIILLIPLALGTMLAVTVFRTVRTWCRIAPGRRPWLIALSLGALMAVAFVVPHIGELEPPWSESPSGLFLVLARVLVLGSVAVVAASTLAAIATAPGEP